MDALDEPDLIGRFAAARDAEDLGRLRPSPPFLNGVPAEPDLAVRLTTGRTRLTRARDDDGAEVVRFTAAGQEIDLAPATASLLRRPLEGGWWTLADLATAASLAVPGLVDGQAACVRAGHR
ncbi:hypothetical protein ACFZDJ_52785 [Streptomyces sp. NPDC007896]|uniref:hypothetical protein n=1 Tax=Streptomyces sp. NPDC007896 TaxID=3364784 RepID=UPI0036E76580